MKRLWLGILLAQAALLLYSEDQFTGRWEVAAVGVEEMVVFEFNEPNVLLVIEDGRVEDESTYRLDEQQKLITIRDEHGESMDFVYRFGENAFVFYLSGSILNEITGSLSGPFGNGGNELTQNMGRSLEEAIRQVMSQNPFMQGIRLE